MIRNVTVFCASSKKTSEKYLNATREIADILIDHQINVIYGGGAVGLMGCLADRYIERGGTIRGVIPDFMVKVEWGHPLVRDMVVVRDMHERKKLLITNTDAVIALPGGTGTLEELMEVLSLKRLGKFHKPVILVNTDGFYNKLIDFFEKMVEENFLRHEHLDAYRVISTPSELIQAINDSPVWDQDAINSASV
jgi:uncharacterized protein (TIGR00730 family)